MNFLSSQVTSSKYLIQFQSICSSVNHRAGLIKVSYDIADTDSVLALIITL